MVFVSVVVVAFQGVPRLEGFVDAQLAGKGSILGVRGHVPIVFVFGFVQRDADLAGPWRPTMDVRLKQNEGAMLRQLQRMNED